jgi:hypothetical protein
MPSPLDTYVAEYSALVSAEQEASTLVQQISRAHSALGKPHENDWKRLLAPAVGNAGPGNGLSEWPTTDQVSDKIRAYHEAFSKADLAYQALTAEQKVSVMPMSSRHPGIR